MSLQVFLSAFLAVVAWIVVKRVTAPKSPLSDIAGPAKEHWLKGNYHKIFLDGLEYNLRLAEQYGGAVKIHAMLGEEQLIVSDPLALHNIVVKEQHVFEETDMFIMGNRAIFGEGLIATLGEQHKKQRKMLNPVFSLANMRALLPIIQPIAAKLHEIILDQVPSDGRPREINVLPLMSRTAFEYICQAGLGYSFNAQDPTKPNNFTEAIRNLTPTAHRLLLLRPYVPLVVRSLSVYWQNKLIDWLPMKPLQEMRRISYVMWDSSKNILAEKRAALYGKTIDIDGTLAEGNLDERMRGRDIMSIMLRANTSSNDTERLTESELLGQMTTIVFAGFETTTTAICRILYILARKPEVQARLRSEVRDAKQKYAASHDISKWEDVDLPYDDLMSLPYLDAVIRETLRVHPPTSLLSRTTRADTTLPLQYPVRSASGSLISSIPLKKNTTVIISILAANHNKDVWGDDASEWKPERWLTASGERIQFGEALDRAFDDSEEIPAVEGAPGTKNGIKYPGVYASMMTFLGGGRACIGFKFAEMEMKQVLTTLLSTMHFALPSSPDENGNVKEIYWKINGLQVPMIRPPVGDNVTAQVPLDVRLVRETDFLG